MLFRYNPIITNNNNNNNYINNLNNNNSGNSFPNPTLLFPIKVSKNEFNLYLFLANSQTKLSKTLPLFSSMAKYYNLSLINQKYSNEHNQLQEINNKEEVYKDIKDRMRTKLFQETSKNNCAICGFKTLFYNDLVQHLDIHFYSNLLEMEGKNLFRKKALNKNSWIYGNKGKIQKNKNTSISIVDYTKNGGTLENLIFYRNMMNNNLVKISSEEEEDNEEYMYPINEEKKKECHYCGDDFKKIFSTKYNYWFYNKVVVVIDDKDKYLAHKDCYEELVKKIK